MEPRRSVPYSQQPFTSPYCVCERSQSTLSHNISLKSVVIFYYLCLFLSRSLVWYTHRQNVCRFSSFPCVLHAQPITLITSSEDYRTWSVYKRSFFLFTSVPLSTLWIISNALLPSTSAYDLLLNLAQRIKVSPCSGPHGPRRGL
jgi:hypothetical protein